ncbi:MAG: hypothetical protein RLZZ459_1190, partial [Cyanobacteriota bacterium]
MTQNLCESLDSSVDQRVHTEQRVQTEDHISAPSELAQQTAVETESTDQQNAENVAVDLSALDVASSVAAASDEPVEVSTTVIPAKPTGFASFGFAPELLDALTAIGYEEPSPIQKAAIPELLLGRDLVGQAQTGTGKTAAFALPMLAALDDHQRTPQVLVLTPTRELAIQVADAFKSYAVNMPHLRVLPLYGGSDFRDQIVRLKRGVQIVVGTPGR